jgi:serine/threonine protein kinase
MPVPPFATYEVGSEPIAGYRLVELLGRGLFAEVWLAEDAITGRMAAVKIMDLSFSGGTVADFRMLIRMTVLAHPHLVPVFATRLKDRAGRELDPEQAEIARQRGELKELIIVMGRGEKSLAERLLELNPEGTPPEARQGLPVEELFRYMEGAAKGIDYLNKPDHHLPADDGPIVHGTVKPSNLFIFGEEVRIADAGLYALLDPSVRRAVTVGAPAYTAPELVANQPSPATDQYALAVCYYELRTGRLPFDGGMGHNSILVAHSLGRLDFAAPDLTEAEREVLKRGTAMHPTDRYPSCVKLIRDLSRAAEKLFPKLSTRTLKDTAGVPFPSPLRPDSYWQTILAIPQEQTEPITPGIEEIAHQDHQPLTSAEESLLQIGPQNSPRSTPTDPTIIITSPRQETPPHVSTQTPEPKPDEPTTYSSIRSTPILLPVDPLFRPPSWAGDREDVSVETDRPADLLSARPDLDLTAGSWAVEPTPKGLQGETPPADASSLPPTALSPQAADVLSESGKVHARPALSPSASAPSASLEEAQVAARETTLPPRRTPVRSLRPSFASTLATTAHAAIPSCVSRQITIHYYARMHLRRVFPLEVELSAWQLREAAQPVSGSLPDLVIEPILPGCDCHPRRAPLPVGLSGEPTTVAFRIVPQGIGPADKARVVVKRGGRIVREVPLDVAIVNRTWAWACAAAGLLAPFGVIGLRWLPAATAGNSGFFESVGRWIGGNVPPDLIGFGLLATAAGLFAWSRPRPAVATHEMDKDCAG